MTALFITAALVGGVAGCGSSDSSSSSTTATPVSSSSPDTTEKGTTTSSFTSSSTSAPKKGSGSKSEYATALAKGFSSGKKGEVTLSADGASCVAPKWVDAIGVDRLQAKGVNPPDLEESGFAYPSLGLSKDQATTMIKAFGDCKVDIYGLFIESISVRSSKAQAACVRQELPSAKAKDFLVGALQSDNDPEFTAQLQALGKKCKLFS